MTTNDNNSTKPYKLQITLPRAYERKVNIIRGVSNLSDEFQQFVDDRLKKMATDPDVLSKLWGIESD